MYGKTYMGIERATFLIDGQGKVAQVWRKVIGQRPCGRGSGRSKGADSDARPWREMAVEVLTTADGRAKTALGRAHAARMVRRTRGGHALADWRGSATACALPAPRCPNCCRRTTCRAAAPASPTGRIALLHAVAHIELNAVDLHWDIIARFTDMPMPLGFYDDWVKAADEECQAFQSDVRLS